MAKTTQELKDLAHETIQDLLDELSVRDVDNLMWAWNNDLTEEEIAKVWSYATNADIEI